VTERAWYLNCAADDVGDRAILVGDRGRIARIAEHLEDTRWLNEDRGLTTVTGTRGAHRVTVSAFGMGAPIATVVLHELRQLGVGAFLRLGTVIGLEPVALGDLVIADAAIRREATSGTYVPPGYPAAGDHELGVALRAEASRAGASWHAGLVGSYDGFYSEMLAADGRRTELRGLGVLALDMETSAVLAVGRALGARAASLCAATVDGATRARLGGAARDEAEDALVRVGLEALCTFDRIPTEGEARL
jgi:uridine phosphorylase